MVDISIIGCTLDASIYILKRHFLCGPSSKFWLMDKTFGTIFIKRMGSWYLKMVGNNGFEGTYHPMHHGRIFHRDDSLEKCMNMQANYLQIVVDSLNERFLDILVFTASKLFSPKYFPVEEETHINMCEQ
jgi:hypothetical protein